MSGCLLERCEERAVAWVATGVGGLGPIPMCEDHRRYHEDLATALGIEFNARPIDAPRALEASR